VLLSLANDLCSTPGTRGTTKELFKEREKGIYDKLKLPIPATIPIRNLERR
jgi:hypothetical protein